MHARRNVALTFCIDWNTKVHVWEREWPRRRVLGAVIRRAVKLETAMKTFNIARFLRERRTYWNVIQELSNYTDRELHDIGIDRIDIRGVARLAAKEIRA